MISAYTITSTKRILIVDDDTDILQLLKRLFETKGHLIYTAMDGQEALQKTDENLPDLIILDLVLPKLPGEDVCRQIKRNEKTKNIPIIMLTGKCGDADRIIGRVVGADYYMTKPCDIKKLYTAAENALLCNSH